MAVTYGFYNSINKDRKYSAEQMAAVFDCLISDGVMPTVGQALLTAAGEDLSVIVRSGRAWFNSTWTYNDGDYRIDLTPADVTRSRIDAIVLEVDHTTSIRANSIKAITGTPAIDPVAPTLVNTEFVHQHLLSIVRVAPSASSISSGDITQYVGTTKTPFITGLVATADIEDYFNQWQDDFETWFNNIQSQLEGDVATNLLNMINTLSEDVIHKGDKATTEDVSFNRNADKYVSPELLDVYAPDVIYTRNAPDDRYIKSHCFGFEGADNPINLGPMASVISDDTVTAEFYKKQLSNQRQLLLHQFIASNNFIGESHTNSTNINSVGWSCIWSSGQLEVIYEITSGGAYLRASIDGFLHRTYLTADIKPETGWSRRCQGLSYYYEIQPDITRYAVTIPFVSYPTTAADGYYTIHLYTFYYDTGSEEIKTSIVTYVLTTILTGPYKSNQGADSGPTGALLSTAEGTLYFAMTAWGIGNTYFQVFRTNVAIDPFTEANLSGRVSVVYSFVSNPWAYAFSSFGNCVLFVGAPSVGSAPVASVLVEESGTIEPTMSGDTSALNNLQNGLVIPSIYAGKAIYNFTISDYNIVLASTKQKLTVSVGRVTGLSTFFKLECSVRCLGLLFLPALKTNQILFFRLDSSSVPTCTIPDDYTSGNIYVVPGYSYRTLILYKPSKYVTPIGEYNSLVICTNRVIPDPHPWAWVKKY